MRIILADQKQRRSLHVLTVPSRHDLQALLELPTRRRVRRTNTQPNDQPPKHRKIVQLLLVQELLGILTT